MTQFITFEGIDGCGKTTQLGLCKESLEKSGREVILTRNPGGTRLGKEIREILLHHPGYVSPTCEMLLYMADRVQHMDELVIPALDGGKVVLCDRHMDSTVAYQGYGRGLGMDLIHRLNDIATHGRKPDLTFLLDGPPEELAKRVNKRGAADRLEQEALAFHIKVRDGFLSLAKIEPDRFVVINALDTVENIHQQVMLSMEVKLSLSVG